MTTFELQKLRDLPIEGVAERLGLRVEHHKCLCPFHDDKRPSLTFSTSRNTFHCWACGESGDSISLAEKVLGKDFREACKWLADEHNVIVTSFTTPEDSAVQQKPFDASRYERFFERPWLSPEARKFLFEERKLDERVVRWCRLTSWRDRKGIPWLQIPYYDQQGKLVGVQNRNLSPPLPPPKGGEPIPSPLGEAGRGLRFCFPKGSECGIYNLPVLNLLKPGEPLYITEGCSDCWAMLSAGHKAVAIPSATLFKPKDAELLRGLNSSSFGATGVFRGATECGSGSTKGSKSPLATEGGREGASFHMWPDNDEPGERLFLQLQKVLPNLQHHQLPPDCKDYSEYYLKFIVHSP